MDQAAKEKKWVPINQQWLVRNVPFFLYLSALAVVYIYNGHHAEKMIKDINRTSKELKNLQYEYKMVRSEWMQKTKESEVVKSVLPYGIKQVSEPPVILEDSIDNRNKN